MSQADSIITIHLPSGGEVPVIRRRFKGKEGKRIAIVAGIRGDTPEGMRVAYSAVSLQVFFCQYRVSYCDPLHADRI